MPSDLNLAVHELEVIATARTTSRYKFGQLPRSPFQANFRVADDPPETENSVGGE